jgi:hypothetical protein
MNALKVEEHNRSERGPASQYNSTHEIFYPPSSSTSPSNETEEEIVACELPIFLHQHPDIEHRRFTEQISDGSIVFGHVVYIGRPSKHFSIQPPATVPLVSTLDHSWC